MGVRRKYVKAIPIIAAIIILLISPLMPTSDIEDNKSNDKELKYICIPFSRKDTDLISNFTLKENVVYKVGNSIINSSLDIKGLAYLSDHIAYLNGPFDYDSYIKILTEKAVKGDFSEEVKRDIEIARQGHELQYLAELISWIDKNMSTEEMMSLTVDKINNYSGYLRKALTQYGAYQMLYLLSQNETYVLVSCSSPRVPPPPGTYYLSNWQQAGRVWVGCYSSGVPSSGTFLGEFCTDAYTTNFNYYWNLAKSGRCRDPSSGNNVPGTGVNSIQIKFFHLAYLTNVGGYSGYHDMIWGINKNSTHEWSKYIRYKTTNPPSGYYSFVNYNNVLTCCFPPQGYCNKHCFWMSEWGYCFACDTDATQHFITGQP